VPTKDHTTPGDTTETVSDPLDGLLGDAVVYDAGEAPPEAEQVASFDDVDVADAVAGASRESSVSPVFWAAAIVWNLPGGIGGWWLLRRTHPRTARRLLVLGIASCLVIVTVVTVVVKAQERLNPSYVFIRK
jgi:hypothetical protein